MSEQDNNAADTSVDETATAGDEAQASQPEDRVKNLQSEVSRKFDNLNSRFAEITQSLQELASQKAAAAAAPQPTVSLRDKMFDNPDEAAEIITQRATERADQMISARMDRQQAMQQRINEVTVEYPEFMQNNGEASVTARRIHDTLPNHLRNTAEGAELALQRAALQLGLTPASRRRKPAGVDDGYIPPSSGSGRGRSQPKENELSDEQFTFAHLLNESIGRKFDDKKLKQYAGRKTWNKFGAGDES